MDHNFTRRTLLQQVTSALPFLLAGGGSAEAQSPALPPPASSGLDHVVVVTMENRSFDHYLGWLPGADGRQQGLTYLDREGRPQATYHLTDFQGCGHPDPDHSFTGGRTAWNQGACDGWLRAGRNDAYAIGYYDAGDLAFFQQAAPTWTTLDRYFSAIMASSYPNRFYLHAGQTDRLGNSNDLSTLPTIWDRLAQKGLTGRYYFSDVPYLALWGAKYLAISRPFAAFVFDCLLGRLPQVSYVEPRFLVPALGTSSDDHPFADIRNGQAFLNTVYGLVTHSPNWPSTLLIITYDEWGGFFDHVSPALVPDTAADRQLRGFRVPCLLISPYARKRSVAHGVYDHTSVLKLLEWRWELAPLSVRDAAAHNLAEALDFSRPDVSAPEFSVPSGPFGSLCLSGRNAQSQMLRSGLPAQVSATAGERAAPAGTEWQELSEFARRHGWRL